MTWAGTVGACFSLVMVAAAAATLADTCKQDSLRLVVLTVDAEVIGDAKGKYNRLMWDTRQMLLNLPSDLANPDDPDFAYLRRLKPERVAADVLSSPAGMDAYWRNDKKDALEVIGTYVLTEGKGFLYQSEAYVGPECGLSNCYFSDEEVEPPPVYYELVKRYQRVLTLYALAVDASRAQCSDKVVQRLLEAARDDIQDLEERNLRFRRVSEIKGGISRRLQALGSARPTR